LLSFFYSPAALPVPNVLTIEKRDNKEHQGKSESPIGLIIKGLLLKEPTIEQGRQVSSQAQL